MKSIRDKKDKLDAKRATLNAKVKSLQDTECSHVGVHIKYRGSSGNYDPSADSYWIDWRCPHCDKFWVTDQNPETYAQVQTLQAIKI